MPSRKAPVSILKTWGHRSNESCFIATGCTLIREGRGVFVVTIRNPNRKHCLIPNTNCRVPDMLSQKGIVASAVVLIISITLYSNAQEVDDDGASGSVQEKIRTLQNEKCELLRQRLEIVKQLSRSRDEVG